jgi:hypothetical protein
MLRAVIEEHIVISMDGQQKRGQRERHRETHDHDEGVVCEFAYS